MPDLSLDTATPDGRGVRRKARDVANPATVKGAVALLAGASLVVLPDLSLTVVELVLGLALIGNGFYDLAFAVLGRRVIGRDRGSRWLAILRGVLGVAVGLLLLVAPQSTFRLLIVITGFYLMARGVLSLGAAVFSRDARRRQTRLTTGAASTAFGILAIAAPRSLTDGLIVLAAVIAMLAGAVLLYYGLRAGVTDEAWDRTTAGAGDLLWDWIRSSDIGDARRTSLGDSLYFEDPDRLSKLAAWWTMLMLSVAIATFAILQDSTAVVIGAMLIAPLMTPILGLSGAIVSGWRRRAWASTRLVAMGVAASVALAYVIAAWVPKLVSFDANSQIIGRVDPTFVDMLIALAAGAAGAFATVNIRVASSIAGVAIAVALVPPLGVVGVSLEAGRFDDAFGALLLFMTNFVSIVLAAAAMFVISGFANPWLLRQQRRQVASTLAPFGALALVILVPLVFTAEGILADATQQKRAQSVVDDWLGDDTALQVDAVSVEAQGPLTVSVDVAISGAARPPSALDLQEALVESLARSVDLSVEYSPSSRVTVDPGGRVERRDFTVPEN